MRKPRRHIFWLFAGIVACANFSVFDSLAENYPVKPVRMLVGFSTGSTDVGARLVAPKMTEHLGQSVNVENLTGAGGSIANERVATSPPDGYTLLYLAASATILPALRKLPYDLERDLAPVSLVSAAPLVLVIHPSMPAHNVKELIALARARPGAISYGSSGVGSPPHLMGELVKLMVKVDMIHVPYRGGAQNALAAAVGEVQMTFLSVSSLLPLLGAGRVRPLAVTSVKRASLLPSIPTLDESGLPGYEHGTWTGVVAPARVPKDIIARLNAAIVKAVNSPEIKESFNRQGIEPQTSTPEEFAAYIRREIEKNAKLIQASGAKAE